MKKVFLFLSIVMFAFTGVFFACSKDRYAGLVIDAEVASTSSKPITSWKVGSDLYCEVMYNDEFTVKATVEGVDDISTALIFTSQDNESLHKISSSNIENGTRATFKAVAPSYGKGNDGWYKIKVESVETNRRSIWIYVKVVLEVDEIKLTDNLGITYGNPIDLNSSEVLAYKTVDPSSPFETNQKGADFELNTFTNSEGEVFDLTKVSDESDIYCFIDGQGKTVEAFSFKDEVLKVLKEDLEGSVNVSAYYHYDDCRCISKNKCDAHLDCNCYSNSIAQTDISNANEQEIAEYIENEKLKDSTDISIVKPVKLEDISFQGGQVAHYNDSGVVKTKLNTSLYLNSLDHYFVDGVKHYYNYENITFTVNTKANVKIYPELGNILVDGEQLISDNNVVGLPTADSLTLKEIFNKQTSQFEGYQTNISLKATGGSGFAYVDFIVEYTEFSNDLRYSFSDLYAPYLKEQLKELAEENPEAYSKLSKQDKSSKIVVESTAVPINIDLEQNDSNINDVEVLEVYDIYGKNIGADAYGTKIGVNLTLASGTISSKIKDENKVVKVFVSDPQSPSDDVRKYFEFSDGKYNTVTWFSEKVNGIETYYFVLDLSKEVSNHFYVKASSVLATDAKFSLTFVNVLGSIIYTYKNEPVRPNVTEETSLINSSKTLRVKTVKGVEDILVLSKVEEAGKDDVFPVLDKNNVDASSDYNKLILKLVETENVTALQGSIIAYTTNLYVSDEDITYSYDEKSLLIKEIKNETLAKSFEKGFNTSKLEFKKLLSVVGLKLGSTQITFTAKNGFSTVVEVEVVKTYQSARINVEKSYGKDIIAQNFINDYGSESLDYQVSAKVNGTFNVVYTINPDASAVSSVTYASSNRGVATISASGLVETITKGQAIISISFAYYDFGTTTDGYVQWIKSVETKEFVLEVFIPATTITLNAPIINVYDYNSLGYEYKEEANVDIDVIIYPTDASIANMQDNVSFILSNNKGNLVGAKGTYTAFLKQNQTKTTVYVTVIVVEYGVQTSLNCTVNIFKAPQIEEINVNAFEGQSAVNIDFSGKDLQGRDILYLATKNGSRINFRTSIIPGEREVHVDDLVVVIFESNENKDFLGIDNDDSNFAKIAYKELVGYSVITNGQDSFYLDIDDANTGYFYLMIFARDNMTSAIAGENYVKILIQITDGTQQNPYVIRTVNDLVAISSAPEKHYVLGNNLNLGSISNWTPIEGFTGSLNGYNTNIKDKSGKGIYFTISGLKINSVNSNNVGLFATISNTAEYYGAVMNLSLEVAAINLSNYTVDNVAEDTINIGAIAGTNYGVIINSSVKFNIFRVGLLNKNAYIGGMVGTNGNADGSNGGVIINFSEEYDNDSNGGSSIAYDLEKNSTNNIVSVQSDFIPTEKVNMISSNPINGTIIVSDTYEDDPEKPNAFTGSYVWVGGMVGHNDNGVINGLYGYYNLVNEYANSGKGTDKQISYLVNFQSQGIDAKVNINYDKVSDVGSIKHDASSLGGIVGKLSSGYIRNVAAEGNIGMLKSGSIVGAKNSIGGIVGKSTNEDAEIVTNYIKNVSASVKLRGNSSIGGIVGYASLTDIEHARVEAYESLNSQDQTLIIGSNSLGGIVGYASTVNMRYVYSYSYINDFNENYIGFGDIYSNAENAILGGLVGNAAVSPYDVQALPLIIESSYSTFNIYAYGKNSMVGGLVGNIASSNKPVLKDIAYTGVLHNDTVGVDDSTARTSWAYNVSSEDSNPSIYDVSNYYYFNVFKYVDSNDFESGVNYDSLVVVDSGKGQDAILGVSSTFSVDAVIKLNAYTTDGTNYTPIEVELRVPKYSITSSEYGSFECYFVKFVPSSITVTPNGDEVVEDEGTLTIGFKENISEKFYSYKDDDGTKYIIMNYSALNNSYDLHSLFTINPDLTTYGNLNILVSSSDEKNLYITDDGKLVLNRVGTYILTFVVKENVSADDTVKVVVLKNFDKLLVSSLPTFKTSLFDNNDKEDAYTVRVKTEVNMFNVFAEYVTNRNGQVSYEDLYDGVQKYLVQITNSNNYELNYAVSYSEDGDSYTSAKDVVVEKDGKDVAIYSIKNGAISFVQECYYKVEISVKFTSNGLNFVITNPNWAFFFKVYSGATSITSNVDEIWLQGQEIYDKLQLSLTSDVGSFEDLYIIVADEEKELEYQYFYSADESKIASVEIYDCSGEERVIAQDVKEYPFNIQIEQLSVQNDIYYYNLILSITTGDTDFKSVSTPKYYKFVAFDGRRELQGDKSAKVELVIAPQSVKGVSAIHYTYTQQVSKLENFSNTNADGSTIDPDTGLADNKNYSYSFSGEPKNTVIAGNEGLFVIDLYPFYANITSVSIDSSLSADSGNSLQFAQLVKIKSTAIASESGYCYIYAPLTQATENNGIYLSPRYSYVPENCASIGTLPDGSVGIEYHADNEEKKLYYKDVDIDEENKYETYRLYVKTVAPTNLKEEEQFVVTVTVKYIVVNDKGELEEKSYVYEHILVVESIPGVSLVTSHDGKERNVIAYTGTGASNATTADWLDLFPYVEDGYQFERIVATLYREGNETGVENENFGSNTDYVEIRGNNKLILGRQARPGDVILLDVIAYISYDGYKMKVPFVPVSITVVDVVISSVSIKDMDADNNLKITVSTSRQLRAVIDGYGLEDAIEKAENKISRSIAYETNTNYYWYAKSNRAGEEYVNLESSSLRNSLPFVVSKLSISNTVDEVTVTKGHIGSLESEDETPLKSLSKVVVLEGSTEAGIVEMLLSISYVYNPQEGSIVFVPNSYDTYYTIEKYFNVIVSEDSNEDNPTPIYDEEDLVNVLSKATIGSFILMNDITINKHTALSANFSSFDGNNKIITINSFNYNTDIIGSTGNHKINLGLFDTVSSKTILKNVIVAYPANKLEEMNLSGYNTINFGGIAAVNNGIITNCDVISVTENRVSLNNYNDVAYTWNIRTAVTVGSTEVKANVGGLVAVNNSTGIITNSRVGRDTVEVLKVYDSEATVVYKENYNKTAPITAVKVEGRANVAGFVAENSGTISTSYAKNLQLEVIGGSTRLVKTGGFVYSNTGYIYGSYVAGWEEEEGNTEGLIESISGNRKLGGGLYSDGFIGGFVYENNSYIEDCYSNINVSGDLKFAAKTIYIKQLIANGNATWPSTAVGGFVFSSSKEGYITTSYSLSKISSDRLNTHGAFEGKIAPSSTFSNEGKVDNSYFMLERIEDFDYDHEQARMLSDDPVIDLEGTESVSGTNEFIVKASFNNFSFDNSIKDFKDYNGESTGGVWAIYESITGNHGYPELISANTIAISCRVINVTKTNNSETNTYYYTYVDGYDIGSYLNPHLVSNFEQYNNIFRDTIGKESFNENITAKFTGNIRLINNINFYKSEKVYSTSVEYTSLVNLTSIFDGNYLAMYNIKLTDSTEEGQTSFGLFKDIYYAAVKNVTLVIDSVYASQTYAVGALAGVIVNSNISNVTLIASSDTTGTVTGNNYVGGLAGVVISKHEENFYSVSDIKSNLAVVGGTDTDGEISAITTSFIIWERIKPTSTSSGLSEINNNLRLHRLPTTVHYAGGIIGFADLHQVSEVADDTDIKDANIYNIRVGEFVPNTILPTSDVNYDRIVSINTDYAGGLFGFVGAQTYVECAEFIAVAENEKHFIKANEIAGGITAVNLGKISQAYVSFAEEVVVELNNDIVDYVNRNSAASVSINDTLFASGEPSYIGGIAGINVGNGTSLGTGNIIDCYNRVDVKNNFAKGVGGIVGGTYIGQISNVYTTASLMGDLTSFETRIGGIVGKIFENGEDGEGYFADYYEDGSDYSIISMFNIVALNLWDKDDFDDLFEYVRDGGTIGALYGEYTNIVDEPDVEENIEEEGLIRLTGSIFVQNYAIKDFSDPYISSIEQEDLFDVTQLGDGNYFELWGVQPEGKDNYDFFLNGHLCDGQNNESLIYPNDYRALYSGTEYGVSTLRETYFPSTKWSRIIWNFEWDEETDKHRLPVLDYGYESSVIRIYTAHQFVNKLKEGNSSGKLYVIMNDIDFTNVTNVFPIATTFRGQLYGNNVTYKDSITGYTYTRKPILFNISINQTEMSTGVFAMLQNSIGATYSNFNIVLKEYNVQFSALDSETIASVLLGNATNSTINNVNIYGSLAANVNKEILLDYKFNSSLVDTNYMVTQGCYIDDSSKEINEIGKPFLKLATLKSDDTASTENKNFNIQYTFNLSADQTKYVLYSKYNAKEKEYTYLDGMSDIEKATQPINVGTPCVATTNASTTGMLIGASSLSYVTSSSVNLNINVTYNIPMTNLSNGVKYVGAVVGRNIGEMRYVTSTSNITVNVGGTRPEDGDVENLYVGGIVGSAQGVIRYAYVKNNTIGVGTNTPIIARNGAEGIFVGGVVGEIDRYTTVNEAIVGGANYLYVNDCQIDAYVTGPSNIAGAIGRNNFTVGDIYIRQSKNASGGTDKSINVYVDDSRTSLIVGGVISTNKSTYISNVYSNTSVYAHVTRYSNIIMGGIIAQIETDCEMTNIANDAKELKVVKTGTNIAQASIGGILAAAADNSTSKVTLENVFTAVNIIAEQEVKLNVGGAVGSCANLIVCNVIVLGNITLNRGNGDGAIIKKDTSTVSSNNYFYSQPHNIGGLIGACTGYNESIDNDGVMVLSTIRDYAIAQKLQLNLGPVIGTNNTSGDRKVTNMPSKTYFCEPIALASDNGYNEYFTNVDQSNITLTGGDNTIGIAGYGIYQKLYDKILGAAFQLDKSVKVYSNYFTNYYTLGESPKYKEGSKLAPYVYTSGSLASNTYYVLSKDIKTKITSDGTGWVLNGQGNRVILSDKNSTIINTVSKDSALVGIMVVADKVTVSPITDTNNGFIFGCGTAGTIGNNSGNLGGLVDTNNAVINSCFSIANIVTTGVAGGLVNSNGSGSNIGNIYSSYYTGTISSTKAENSTIAGLAVVSEFGVISNSYTMGDLDITKVKPTTYPIANTRGKYNLYNTYYDYIAYTGANEGLDKENALQYKLNGIERVNEKGKYVYGLISDKGVYVWSSTLAGDEKGLNYTNMEDLLKGSWLKPGNEEQIINMFKKVYTGNEEININTSWFNYGYTTNNMTNIVANIDGNIVDYLQMLYTGNGLAPIENVTAQKPQYSYEIFVKKPYHIKHAGMLDILVRANNAGEIQFKYYIFERNLDFVKYSKQTYWSESWDRNLTVFVGNLDGNEKTVYNMYSSFGLLRALPSVPSAKDEYTGTTETIVKDFTFENCYSKTGLVAGFQGVGKIQNIVFKNSSVINGNWENKIKSSLGVFTAIFPENGNEFKEVSINSISMKVAQSGVAPTMGIINNNAYTKFAGGVVGFMDGGIIEKTNSFTGLNVVLADSQANDGVGYVGGLVGIMQGGTISGKSTSDLYVVGGVNVYAIFTGSETAPTPYVGGIAGIVLDNAKISYVKLNKNNTTVSGYYSIGGIAGKLFGGQIEYCNNLNNLRLGNAQISNTGAINQNVTTSYKTFEVMIGGIIGELVSGNVEHCTLGESISKNATSVTFIEKDTIENAKETISLGGIVGKVSYDSSVSEKPSVTAATVEKDVVISSSNVTTYVGGIIGSMYNGQTSGSTSSGTVQATTSNTSYGVAGGIVGYMENGSVGSNTYGKAKVQDSCVAGGIVGQINIVEVNNKIEISNTQTTDSSIQTNTTNATKAGGVVGLISSELPANGTNDLSKNYVKINDCTTDDKTLVGSSSAVFSGGIVGAIFNLTKANDYIKVENCTNKASVDANSNTPVVQEISDKQIVTNVGFAGGIVGYMTFSSLKVNTNEGTVGGRSAAYYAGGIIAHMQDGYVENATNKGIVKAQKIAGGIVAVSLNTPYFIGTFKNETTIQTSNGIAGGLFGIMSDMTTLKTGTSSYASLTNTGIVQGNTISGGVVGLFNGNSTKAITNATNSAAVKVASTGKIQNIKNVAINYAESGYILQLNNSTNYIIPEDVPIENAAGGIIGYSKADLTIYDLETGTNSQVEGKKHAGGIVGNSESALTITDVTNKGSVSATDRAGGIVGTAGNSLAMITTTDEVYTATYYGPVKNTGAITATTNAGGIIGYVANIKQIGKDSISETITNEGKIESDNYAGGIIGYLQSSGSLGINSTINKGSVAADKYAGGLVGYMAGGKLNHSNKISLSSGNTIKSKIGGSKDNVYAAGGIVGYMEGSAEINVDVASVSFGASTFVGGLVGHLKGGTVKGTVKCDINTTDTAYAGGLVGFLTEATLQEATVTAGKIVKADSYAGGMVGYMHSGYIMFNEAKNNQGGNPEASTGSGGLVGFFDGGTIKGGNGGSVTVKGESRGGLVGVMNGSGAVITNEGEDKKPQGGAANGGDNNGGMVGLLQAGTISGGVGGKVKNGNAGGMAGKMTGGTINGGKGGAVETGQNCGGMVGELTGTDSNGISGGQGGTVSYGNNAGGIAGKMTGGSIKHGCSGGRVEDGEDAGGLVGYISSGTITIEGGGGSSVTGTNAGGVVGLVANGTNVTINGGGVSSVDGSSTAGGVVGNNKSGTSLVINVNFNGGVYGGVTGGLIGQGGGSVCSTSVNVTGAVDGGIVGDLGTSTLFFGSSSISIKASQASALITKTNNGSIGSNSNVSISGNDYEGSLVNTNKGTIAYLEASGIVASNTTDYGVIAQTSSDGTISNCTNNSEITGKDNTQNLGGIVGKVSGGTIVNCINNKSVSSSKAKNIGGIVGLLENGTVGGTNCTNSGDISFTGDGYTSALAIAAYEETAKTVTARVGGIVGSSGGTAEGKNTGTISNAVNYYSNETEKKAKITDYRGQIAGESTGGSVKNLTKHTEFKITGDAPERIPDGNAFSFVVAFTYSGYYIKNNSDPAFNVRIKEADSNWVSRYASSGRDDPNDGWEDYISEEYRKLAVVSSGTLNSSSFGYGPKNILGDIHNRDDFNNATYPWSGTLTHITGTASAMAQFYSSGYSTPADINEVYNFAKAILFDGQSKINGGKAYFDGNYSLSSNSAKFFALCDEDFSEFQYTLAVVFSIQKYSLTPDTQQGSTTTELQDCGGEIPDTTASGEYQTENGHRLQALVELYKKCGPCDTKNSSGVTSSSVAGYSASQSPGSTGGSNAVTEGIMPTHPNSLPMPLYDQTDFPNDPYGDYGSVASHGCGITSVAMIYAYFIGQDVSVPGLANQFGHFNTPNGSYHSLFKKSAATLGIPFVEEVWGGWSKVVAALQNGQPVVSIQDEKGYFTSGGHFIVLTGITADGRILVNDPNGANYRKNNSVLKEGFANGFTQAQIQLGDCGGHYHIYGNMDDYLAMKGC